MINHLDVETRPCHEEHPLVPGEDVHRRCDWNTECTRGTIRRESTEESESDDGVLE